MSVCYIQRAIRKLGTDVVTLQALRSKKVRAPYALSDGGALHLHVSAPDATHAAPALLPSFHESLDAQDLRVRTHTHKRTHTHTTHTHTHVYIYCVCVYIYIIYTYR